MGVRIRFARFGRKKLPFYRIYVADSRSKRDGRFLENVGYYNPITGKDGEKQFALKADRVQYWLSVGAQPSNAVARLLARTGNLPSAYPRGPPESSSPSPLATLSPDDKPDVTITAKLSSASSAPMLASRILCFC
ncbi:uncharacterized protein LOC9634016 [Selaginella moellendorffii]|nr:uncharacterized protein LOC9634016 [Selaginella moellendorffii]XP_024526439.1 uncharacterized protein LOC9634016 [Selaginella moellendorffii]|eukprot:XP_024526438.1 uncharacterized protein LOC9634016 [Selaginella moellendorffii]